MTLDEARMAVLAYADGELSGAALRDFEAVLAQHPQLRGEVEQCRTLRQRLNRFVSAAPVPSALRERVRIATRRRSSARRWALLAPVVGIAAVIAWFLLPRAASPDGGATDALDPALVSDIIEPDAFAAVHLKCACGVRHNPIEHSKFTCPADAQRAIARNAPFGSVPDLAASGYELDGLCACFNQPNVDVVHAYYRFPGNEPEVLSVFSINRHVHLSDAEHVSDERTGRSYEVGRSNDVTIVMWNGTEASFAVCGRANVETILVLAETINVAFNWIDTGVRFASAAFGS